MDYKQIIKTWKGRLHEKGITQKELSIALDISQTRLSLYINGHAVPSLKLFSEVERILSDEIQL